MKKALSSFAIIKNSFDEGEDYIGAFVPLVVMLFDTKNYQVVEIETICKDFEIEYGLRVPRHPMETILNRMKPQFVTKTDGKVKVNQGEIRKRAQTIDFRQERKKYDWLLENFINFCKDFQTPVEISHDEADHLFLAFLKEHDIDVVFAIYEDEHTSILPADAEFSEPDKKYLINRYVNLIMQEGGEYAKYLIDSAVGHNYASTILYREFSNVRGKGTCKNYYFDTGIFFDIAGINKEFRKKAAEDFLAMLKNKGSSLFVFRHNYDEFLQIAENCLNWIESNYYDPNKASRTLQFFKDEGYSAADLQFFISKIPDILKKNHIEIATTLDPNLAQEYQIGREDLKRIILETYNSYGYFFDLEEKEDTLERDITSIERIYKLRKGMASTGLNNTSYVFVTTNAGLAYASAKFEKAEMKHGYFTIPPALTDTFVGTVIWVQEPTSVVEEYNKSKLIAYTAAAIHPKANMMVKFAQAVERAKSDTVNPISEESAMMLLESNLSRRLLSDKTLGDSNRITASTPYEVLEEMKNFLVRQEKVLTSQAKQSLEIEKTEKERIASELNTQTTNIKNLIEVLSVRGRKIFVGMLIAAAIIFYAFAEFYEPKPVLVKIISYVISVASIISSIGILAFGEKVETYIRTRLTGMLLKR
ncbi:hypothetical protein GW793_00060 [bacterium]|nr:hypothetical protein [bacterium]